MHALIKLYAFGGYYINTGILQAVVLHCHIEWLTSSNGILICNVLEDINNWF